MLLLLPGAPEAATLPVSSPQIIVSASSAWGSDSDAWAGYTGSLQIYSPAAIKAPWTLSFVSRELGAQASGFWNGNATYDAQTGTWTITSPAWDGGIAANQAVSLGFNGQGVLRTSDVLAQCTLNGVPCVASVKSSEDARQTISSLVASGSSSSVTPGSGDAASGSSQSPPQPGSNISSLEALFSVSSSWNGGFSGNLTVKNTSSVTLPAGTSGWIMHLKFPDKTTAQGVFQSGPWNFIVGFGEDGGVTITPQSWSAALAPGATISSGFNGTSVATLQKAVSLDAGLGLQFAASVPAAAGGSTDGGSGGNVVSPADSSGTVTPGNIALPTGSAGGFIFSPYKDATLSMNWNTNVVTTAVGGKTLSLLQALPVKVPAVTLAFATGTCGSENWGGVKADDFAKANIPLFVAQGRDYLIATGGAAGAFQCGTADGMRAFINRYASKNLIGVDFDIEAGQSQTDILNLVKALSEVQGEYPGLRFSFTIATLASSNGGALTSPYGDLNVIGYNTLTALSQYPINNYTINLMVMDYGAAGSQTCVVGGNGKCSMGLSAIQAAKNLKDRFAVPFGRIELTPMIGVNDVSDEIFSLSDVDVMTQWIRQNALAGVHFWSVDRDTPCQNASTVTASPLCSSVQGGAPWDFTGRFLLDLGI